MAWSFGDFVDSDAPVSSILNYYGYFCFANPCIAVLLSIMFGLLTKIIGSKTKADFNGILILMLREFNLFQIYIFEEYAKLPVDYKYCLVHSNISPNEQQSLAEGIRRLGSPTPCQSKSYGMRASSTRFRVLYRSVQGYKPLIKPLLIVTFCLI